ncbi:ATP12 family chaperone protein [Sphingomonas prati]|uniref:Chaperone required for assembly of F1-ATPase n=1 Tax=Sphingomonas prati TaxID=1843237 RepID=A0A7W9F1T4_9SPHN|nr:ATP12 family protein [Sphingomonas prati]MBB5728089.1 chaperone required for assembly of F1-ATPase [Sphingomonas prati]GGE83153.1 ATPase [Sphingomonas prati]
MKRFWTDVAVVPADSAPGYAITLDTRPVRTPMRLPLVLPTRALADAVAAEWATQGEEVDPRTMPMTGLSNAAIDRVMPDAKLFVDQIAAYAETDLLCYRADAPNTLVARQAEAWDPLLAWARTRYDVALRVTTGIVHVAQPPETLARLRTAVAAHDAHALAALSPLTTIAGSLIAALAVAERHLDADAAFDLTHLDELWQVERWGEDTLATEARVLRKADFVAAARFLDLSSPR